MDPQRQGEIALKLVKHYLNEKGFDLSSNNVRDMGNTAKQIGVSSDELKEFMRPLAQEALDDCFGTKALFRAAK